MTQREKKNKIIKIKFQTEPTNHPAKPDPKRNNNKKKNHSRSITASKV
jgi:hypothetical protein